MKIYIDLMFIQDTIVMSTILCVISKLIGIKIKMVRVLIISCFSSVVSILILTFFPTLFDNLLIKFFISFLLVKYGFKIKESVTTIQKTIVFWCIVFLMGGLNLLMTGNMVQTLIVFGLMSISIINIKKNIKKQLFLESAMCMIEFEYQKKHYCLKALLDTGHDVKTAYGEDVIFIRKNIIEEGGGGHKRIVSYKTISGIENKCGKKINDIIISYGNRKVYNNAVIVSTPNISQGFDAIVSYNLIEGGMTDGNTNSNETKSQKVIC